MSFLEELKRRRVVRVAIVYGAVAFAVLQVADILVPALRLPQWTMTMASPALRHRVFETLLCESQQQSPS